MLLFGSVSKERQHLKMVNYSAIRTYVTRSGKTGLIATITDIHFLSVRVSCTHALLKSCSQMDRSAFTDSFLPMLSNHEDEFHGSGGH